MGDSQPHTCRAGEEHCRRKCQGEQELRGASKYGVFETLKEGTVSAARRGVAKDESGVGNGHQMVQALASDAAGNY